MPKAELTIAPEISKKITAHPPPPMELAYGFPRNFLDNRYVYVVLSPRVGA